MPVLKTSQMSVNNVSRILIYNSRAMLQIVASLTDNSRSIIYDCNVFIVKTLGEPDLAKKVFLTVFSRTSVVAGCACHVVLESGTTPGRGASVSQNLPLFHLQSRLENVFRLSH
jgi:hypothetical protein